MLKYEVGPHQELTSVVEMGVTGGERSRTCEVRGLMKVNSTQLDNTTRLSVQDENADGQRSERRALSAWASLAKEAWRRVYNI